MPANVILDVTYQVHLPNTTGNPGQVDIYRRDPVECFVVCDGTDSGLATVLNNNITLQAGEVYDILQVTPMVLDNKPIFQ